MPAAAVLPSLISTGASIGASAIGSHFAGKAQQNQLDAAGRAVAANQAAGSRLMSQGDANTGAASNYYKSLLGGRTAAQGAVAPAASNIRESFAGAQAGLDRSLMRGGQKDKAAADLNRDKTNQVSRLFAGVQPGAANALAGMGEGQTRAGAGLFGGAPGQLNDQARTGIQLADQQAKQGSSYGQLMFRVLSGMGMGGAGKKGLPPGPQITPGLSWLPGGQNVPGFSGLRDEEGWGG